MPPAGRELLKNVAFSLVPLLVLVGLAEGLIRAAGWADSPIAPMTLAGEAAGLMHLDEELFWSLEPSKTREHEGVTVHTNSLGLRSPEVGEKRPDEFRVLSLGESSTFGVGVGDHETYSWFLEQFLDTAAGRDRFSVINAGVPAYSSFQSLKYLELRGLDLEPDLVLFYHEGNDFLPSYLRASDNSVIGMNLSDPERYADRLRRTHRKLLAWSAVYRFARYRLALASIEKYQESAAHAKRPTWDVQMGDEKRTLKFPFRVRSEERSRVFAELVALTREHGIGLVVYHPSYRGSIPHECLITEFCRRSDVPMIDTQDLLHLPDGTKLFWDLMHPTPFGHLRIAEATFNFLVENGLVPTPSP